MQDGWQQHIFSLVVVNLITKWLTNSMSYELTKRHIVPQSRGGDDDDDDELALRQSHITVTESALVKRQIKCFCSQTP